MNVRPTTVNVVLERLKDNAAEDTIHMAREVKQMLDSPGWAFLTDFLEQVMVGIDTKLEKGVHEHVEYAAFAAEKRGLRVPLSIAEAIVEAGRRAERNLNEMASRLEAGETP